MPSHAEFRRAAQCVIEAVGKDNIASATHCALRLRLVLHNKSRIRQELLDQEPLIKGYFFNAGEFQIVFGAEHITAAYAAFEAVMAENPNTGFSKLWRNLSRLFRADSSAENTSMPPRSKVLPANPIPLEWQQPINGDILPLSAVPEESFAHGDMGIGFAISPSDGEVRSPVNGSIIAIFPTKHAIVIRADNGTEILIHIGIDSIKLRGEGIRLLVGIHKRVSAGQALLQVDWDFLRRHISTVSPIIFPEYDKEQWTLYLDKTIPYLQERSQDEPHS